MENGAGTIIKADGFQQNILAFPVGVTFTKDITLASGWTISPGLDFTVIPAAGDIKAKQDPLHGIFPQL